MSRALHVRKPAGKGSGMWVACRCCGADDPVETIRSHDRLLGLPEEFVVVRCRRCGFLYTNPQPDDATLAARYPPGYYPAPGTAGLTGSSIKARLRAGLLVSRGYSVRFHPGLPSRVGGWIAGRVLAQRFVWVPSFVPGGTLVDVGCGTGAYLAGMRDLGWNVLGVEPSPHAAEEARRAGLDVRTGDLEEARFPDASADVMVARMVLEHVRDPRATLAEVRRILKPGGRLLLSVPNAGSLEAKVFGRFWFAWELPRHLSHFTPASLSAFLDETGFETVRVRHLVNANNLAQSMRYRRGGVGAADQHTAFHTVLAWLASGIRSAGRIAVEARPRPEARSIRCPLCGVDAEGDLVFRGRDLLTGLPGEWEVVRCRRCDLLVTWPQPSPADLAAFYPQTYPSYRRGPDVGHPARFTSRLRGDLQEALLAQRGYPVAGPPGPVARSAAALLKRFTAARLRRFPAFVAGGTVLDVGCGRGYELAELREKGWRVLGVEFDPGTAELAHEELGLDVRSGTLEEASFSDGSVDVVILRHVLEHLIDPAATLEEIRRVLRPGGRLCIEVPDAGSWEARVFGRRWTGWDLPRHLFHFSPGSLSSLLERAGFRSISVANVPSGRTILASLRLAAKRPGYGWRLVGNLLVRGHTALSLLAAPLGWIESAAGRSGLMWLEAIKAERERP